MADQPEGTIPVELTEPELRVIISVGTQAGGSAHQVIVQEMKNFERLWGEATAVAAKLAKLSPIPTTDLDKDEIKKALEGEPVSISAECTRKNRQEKFAVGCKPKEAADKVAAFGVLISDWIEYEDAKDEKLKDL